MKRPVRLIVLLVSLMMLISVAGCGSASDPSADEPGEIVIGCIGPETGGSAALGMAQKNAVQMAVEEINSKGGVLGKTLKVIFEDDEASPTKGTNAANKLIYQDNVSALIAAVNSSVTVAVRGVTDEAKVPQLTISTGSQVNSPDYEYMFMTALSDRDQAKALINYAAEELGFTKVGFLTAADDYGESGRILLESAAQAASIQVVAQEKYNNNDKDYKTQLLKLKEAGAEGIFMWGVYTDGALILRQARELSVGARFFAGSGMASDKLLELAGVAAEGFINTQAFWPTDENPAIGEFVTKYVEKFNINPIAHAAQAYDTVYILADAIERAGSAEPERIRDALAVMKDFGAITGTLWFDDINVVQGKTVFVIVVKDGKYTLLKTGV